MSKKFLEKPKFFLTKRYVEPFSEKKADLIIETWQALTTYEVAGSEALQAFEPDFWQRQKLKLWFYTGMRQSCLSWLWKPAQLK